jgi:hypothetical protein
LGTQKKNAAGRTKEEHFEYVKKLLTARGENIPSHIPYCIENAPQWDRSCGDPPTITHDCFIPERLFVIPWGSGEGEVGIAGPAMEGKKTGLWVPEVGYKKDGGIFIWDRANNRNLIYSNNGIFVETHPNDQWHAVPEWDIYSDPQYHLIQGRDEFLETHDLGYIVKILDKDHYVLVVKTQSGFKLVLVDMAKQAVSCRVYLAPGSIPGTFGEVTLSEEGHAPTPTPLLNGTVIFPRMTMEGFEIWRYRWDGK